MSRFGYAVLNFLQALYTLVWTCVCITAALVVLILTLRRSAPLWMARRIWAPGLLAVSGVRIVMEGGEGIDFTEPHVFVSNHSSMADIPLCFIAVRANLRFVAKSALAYVPFLGWYMWATGMIFVDRGKTTKAIESLRRAGERVRAGASILAYPEGTRSRDGRVHPFKKGPLVVALEAGVPVVPIAIVGAREAFGGSGVEARPGRTVRVRVGAPIMTDGMAVGERGSLVERAHIAVAELHLAAGGLGSSRDLDPR